MIKLETPSRLGDCFSCTSSSGSFLLPGSTVNTSSDVMPSLRPLTTGASAFVKGQFDGCSFATGTGEEDSFGGGTIFAGGEVISDLHARDAIPIAKMIKRKNFIRDITIEHRHASAKETAGAIFNSRPAVDSFTNCRFLRSRWKDSLERDIEIKGQVRHQIVVGLVAAGGSQSCRGQAHIRCSLI